MFADTERYDLAAPQLLVPMPIQPCEPTCLVAASSDLSNASTI
ncbi:hypothetical protein IQ26_05141 [Mesorhizobium tianshanense]|uniref:Uncharacterized protein n=1 Tax=Mesorhizobium tianshanense TaxID=39844 RepID=A0A562NAW3_9HYPH|nr:hypothetical protein IQ26_05141 [Mesorhizobium tianshanense]